MWYSGEVEDDRRKARLKAGERAAESTRLRTSGLRPGGGRRLEGRGQVAAPGQAFEVAGHELANPGPLHVAGEAEHGVVGSVAGGVEGLGILQGQGPDILLGPRGGMAKGEVGIDHLIEGGQPLEVGLAHAARTGVVQELAAADSKRASSISRKRIRSDSSQRARPRVLDGTVW